MASSVPFAITPPIEDPVSPNSQHDSLTGDGLGARNDSVPGTITETEKEVEEIIEDAKTGLTITPDKISKIMHGKDKEWNYYAKRVRPLQLLELPLDILKEIVRQVSHTSDLTQVALCHSSLHALAVPHIYSRFDIVWPDAHATTDHRTGVDALTYGLATLVMAEDVFREPRAPGPLGKHRYFCGHCGHVDPFCYSTTPTDMIAQPPRTRRGNWFAEYTRKFSLGNGPPDWVQEYQINKESGKMLGTLVALAVARMKNLETFIWDMPTGVLRDVWIALSTLANRDDGHDCRLERVWVRWHDNSDSLPVTSLTPQSGGNAPPAPPGQAVPPPGMPSVPATQIPPSLYRVEYPTFSVLPPLKSLSVLEIDELPYLEEMSVLIHRSKDRLRELRIGVAPHALKRDWAKLSDAVPSIAAQSGASPLSTSRSIPRHDGVLGILVSKICQISDDRVKRNNTVGVRVGTDLTAKIVVSDIGEMPGQNTEHPSPSNTISDVQDHELETPIAAVNNLEDEAGPSAQSLIQASETQQQISTEQLETNGEGSIFKMINATSRSQSAPVTSKTSNTSSRDLDSSRDSSQTRLKLESLELESVPLSITILQRAINWSRLTSLTILRCQYHEQLWKALRRRYTPLSSSSRQVFKPTRTDSDLQRSSSLRPVISNSDYHLNIKKLQTDAVSPALIAFLKDTLAPNSLEWLFLQANRSYDSQVSIESIFKGPIRRHRASLKKLLVDSEDREDDGQPAHNTQWRRWIFPREVLTFMTSGRMPYLREVGMALDYKDWHYFLQRLPQVTQLRSMYIPYIADHVHGRNLDSRELALQILDIAALRPELQVCYLGIQAKCFEILETKASETDIPDVVSGANEGIGTGDSDVDSEDEVDDDENDESAANQVDDGDGTESELESDPHGDSEDDNDYGAHDEKSGVLLKLREILFYDDKVSIFKARHGRL